MRHWIGAVAFALASLSASAGNGLFHSTGAAPSGVASGDLVGTYPNPQVNTTHLSAPLPAAQGGTAATSPGAMMDTLDGLGSATDPNDMQRIGSAGYSGSTKWSNTNTCTFADWVKAQDLADDGLLNGSFSAPSFSDQSDNINHAALWCQLRYYQTFNASLANIFGRANLNFVVAGGVYKLRNPLFCPEGLTCHFEAKVYRDNSVSETGACTDYNWDGSACNALHNTFQPMLIASDGASVDDAYLYAKNIDGTSKGAGAVIGHTYEIVNCAVANGGTGYTNGTAHLANPSFVGTKPQVVLTTSGGVITGCAPLAGAGVRFDSRNGEYTLPPALQKIQYGLSAFITATGVTTFDSGYGDGTTAYLITDGGGTGGSVTVTWGPNWCNGTSNGCGAGSSTPSYRFAQTSEARKFARNVHVFDAATTTADSTFGDVIGLWVPAANVDLWNNWVQGGGYAYDLESSDDRGVGNYTNFSSYGLRFRSADLNFSQFMIDSPIVQCGVLDNVNGNAYIEGKCYENSSSSALTGSAAWAIGKNGSPTKGVGGLTLAMTYENLGKPLFDVDWLKGGNRFQFGVTNFKQDGTTWANQINGIALWGSNLLPGSGNFFTGTYDNITSPFTGTAPTAVGCSIFSGTLSAYIDCNGNFLQANHGYAAQFYGDSRGSNCVYSATGGAYGTYPLKQFTNRCILNWANRFLRGALSFDLSTGYQASYSGGAVQATLLAGGSGYTGATTATASGCTNSLTPNITGGIIKSVTIASSTGSCSSSPTTITFTDSGGGSGASGFVSVSNGGGITGSGETSTQILGRVNDALSLGARILDVQDGTNDVTNSITPATTQANLKATFEKLMAAGKLVIAHTNAPRNQSAVTATQQKQIYNTDAWLRSYARGLSTQNPSNYGGLVLLDLSPECTDPTSSTGAQLANCFFDGTHWAAGGASIGGWKLATLLGPRLGIGMSPSGGFPARSTSQTDAYDASNNPTGALNSDPLCTATAGTASSPVTGTVCTDFTLGRTGSATTIATASVESTRTDLYSGSRQVLTVSAGSGTSTEIYYWVISHSVGTFNITAGTDTVEGSVDVELSSHQKVNGLQLSLVCTNVSSATVAESDDGTLTADAMPITGALGAITASMPMTFRTPPMAVPASCTTVKLQMAVQVDASGGANSASFTIKYGNLRLRKV